MGSSLGNLCSFETKSGQSRNDSLREGTNDRSREKNEGSLTTLPYHGGGQPASWGGKRANRDGAPRTLEREVVSSSGSFKFRSPGRRRRRQIPQAFERLGAQSTSVEVVPACRSFRSIVLDLLRCDMVAGCRYVKTGYGSSRRQKKFVMEKIWTCVLGGASGIAHGPLSGAILLSRGYEGSGLVGEKKK